MACTRRMVRRAQLTPVGIPPECRANTYRSALLGNASKITSVRHWPV